MKIKNIFVLASLVLLGSLLSGFVHPGIDTTSEKNGKISFAEFLSYFKKTDLPYQMELNDFKKYENFKETPTKVSVTKTESNLPFNKFIPELSWGRFSRMGPPKVQPLAYFYPNKTSVGVIYITTNRYGDNINEFYKMVVFDLEGNTIFPKNNVSDNRKKKRKRGFQIKSGFELGHSSIKNTVSFKINKKGQIWKNTYSNVWKENLKETAFHENQLLGFKIKDTEVFQLNEKGVAVKLKNIPSDDRASLD